MKSPLSILSPKWSGFFNLGGAAGAFGISFGGSTVAVVAARVRVLLFANRLVGEEMDGDRFVLSRSASDQLNPSPIHMVSDERGKLEECCILCPRDGLLLWLNWGLHDRVKEGLDLEGHQESDGLRPLPEVLAVVVLLAVGEETRVAAMPMEGVFSIRDEWEEEVRLPPLPAPPEPLPCLTSRRACAPKLTRRANDGLTGVFTRTLDWSSSSTTAGSSPKLFRYSGDPEPEEVATLARRCLAKAVNGLFGFGLLPPRPTVVSDIRFGAEVDVVVGIVAVGGEEDTVDEGFVLERRLKSSVMEERRR